MESGWLLFALLSAIFASLVAIFGKVGLQGVDSNVATAVRAVIMALFLLGVLLLQGKLGEVSAVTSNSVAMKYIVLSGVAGALSWLFYFLALKLGKASQVAPIDRLSVVFTIVLAAILLGERVTAKIAVGGLLIVVGALIIALG
ncbi:EamA-like transporter family protein [uncultured archaeon]|nr:EamA-like transporter family protein [uncultured archaeon]